jgi:primosomal protein N' (replication factor Y)
VPKNETIRLACTQDYERFYEGEIALRRELSYPPFCDMVQLTMTSEREDTLHEYAKKLSDSIVEKLSGEFAHLPFMVFGPFEAQVYKLNEKYRLRMVMKCKLNRDTRRLFHQLLVASAAERDVILSIDMNPLTM